MLSRYYSTDMKKDEHRKKKTGARRAEGGSVAERTPELERLLAEGKEAEAKELLRGMLSAPLSEEERGAILVGFAAAYLALANRADAAYRDALAREVETLERITTLERGIGEKLAFAKMKGELQ